jgi:uncharacterized membrane protein YbaN (DUF454 family)
LPERANLKPLRPIVRGVLFGLGTVALALGIVGIVLPILPTTPFFLVAAGCYLRTSERMYHWLTNHPRLGKPLRLYLERRAIPLRVKVISLAIAWTLIGASAIFVVDNLWLRILLLGIAVAKTIFMARVKTLDEHIEPPSLSCSDLQLD